MKMRLIILLLVLLSAVMMALTPLQQALSLELDRSMKHLRMDDVEEPYFISYRVEEEDSWILVAAAGGIVRSTPRNSRNLFVDVRVGDYKRDNSHFQSRGSWWANMPEQLPIEDDIIPIRYSIWRKTDDLYKRALEDFAQKKTAIEQSQETRTEPDFSKEKPVKMTKIRDLNFEIDKDLWESKLIDLSRIPSANPNIQRSSVTFKGSMSAKHIVNSEGTMISHNGKSYEAAAIAIAQADDGTFVFDNANSFFKTEADIDWKKLEEDYRALTETVEQMRTADTLDYYAGPVLFTGQASAMFFTQILASRITAPNKPVREARDRAMHRGVENDFERRLGRRVASPNISIYADPTMKEYGETFLVGHYEYDDEGVKGQRVEIIKEGVLENFLMSRRPFRDRHNSNGHGRFGWSAIEPMPSNIFIESDDDILYDDLKEEYLQLIQDEGLEYGILVEKVVDRSVFMITASTGVNSVIQRLSSVYQGLDTGSDVRPPLVFYRIYPDGRKEMLRKMAFSGLGRRSLRDIALASKERTVQNFISTIGFSVIAPKGIIVEDVELTKMDIVGERLPVIAKE